MKAKVIPLAIKNTAQYGTPTLLPQVDPEFMQPVLEKHFQELSFYSPEDHLSLQKDSKSVLRFQYSPTAQRFSTLQGTIHAKLPREGFDEVDPISFMKVEIFRPDKDKEFFTALEGIVKHAGIEKVIAYSGGFISSEDAQHLVTLKGQRLPSQLKYGLGLFA